MRNLQDYRRRIRAVKDLIQVTKAMKTVSAARLRRTQNKVINFKPYATRIKYMLSNLASAIPDAHPLLGETKEEKPLLLVISADKGLCGSFNYNVIKEAERFIKEKEGTFRLIVVGRKGEEGLKRVHPIEKVYKNIFVKLNFSHAMEITKTLIDGFYKNQWDSVFITYTQFFCVGRYSPVTERFVPIEKVEEEEMEEYIFEPEIKLVVEELIKHYIELEVWRILLESSTAENAARMIAMDQATRNAQDMVRNLTLEMNKLRQEKITKELLDIVTAIEAMKKSRT